MAEKYVGSLCQRGHEYENTGGSLRSTTRGECIECRKLAGKRYVSNHRDRKNKNGALWNRKRKKENPFGMWNNAIKSRCKKSGMPFDLDGAYLKSLLEEQGNKCYWIGVKISVTLPTMHPEKATVDRLIPKNGYVKGNVVWACSFVNRGRADCPVDQFEAFMMKAFDGAKYTFKQK